MRSTQFRPLQTAPLLLHTAEKEPKLRVLLVDDSESTRMFLRAVIDTVPALEVVDEAGTGRAAIASATDLQPDVILLDLSLPDFDGGQVLPELLRAATNARVVIVSKNARIAGPSLVAAGASGYVEKGLPPQELIHALSRTLSTALPTRGQIPTDVDRRFGLQGA